MLHRALEIEVEDYIQRHAHEIDEAGRKKVVRNSKSKARTVTTMAGSVEVRAPRVNDKREGEKFVSALLPPSLRKTPKIESLLPVLYLRGLSTGKVAETLGESFWRGSLGLSASAVSKLIKSWQSEFTEWKRRPITNEYVYIWADGVNVQARLGDDKKICLLVIIGVKKSGDKELLAVSEGYRESKESWLTVIRDLTSRGFKAPMLAIADGALGFWSALKELEDFKDTKEQGCWVHKIANGLDKLPKKVQPEVKGQLHEMMKSPDKKTANRLKENFINVYSPKYKNATDCLDKSWSRLTTFFDFPAEHWTNLRTTNPIESSFATVKLRTRVTKGAGSPKVAASMAFKLLRECEKKWRKIRGYQKIESLLNGVEYKDGGMVKPSNTDQEVAAS
jgi:transposase-like protein